jgi:hypothetical protein
MYNIPLSIWKQLASESYDWVLQKLVWFECVELAQFRSELFQRGRKKRMVVVGV